MNHYDVGFLREYCPHSNEVVEVIAQFFHVSIIGKANGDFKKLPAGCSNEECELSGTLQCKLWNKVQY